MKFHAMKCHEFEQRFHVLLDDRQLPAADPALAAHAAACESCSRWMQGHESLLVGLRQSVAPQLGDDFARRTVNCYLADLSSDPIEAVVVDARGRSLLGRHGWQIAGWLAACAAALLIGVSIFVASRPQPNDIVKTDPGTGTSKVSPPPALASDLTSEKPGSRTRPGHGAHSGGRSFIPRPSGGYGIAIADMATSLPEAVERIEEVERRYAPGIRPIRISFAMLWEALWRSLPGLGSLGSPEANDREASLNFMDVRRLA